MRTLLRQEEARNKTAWVRKFRKMLATSPKQAHRLLFEGTGKATLQSVRRADGTLTSAAEEVVGAAAAHFAGVSEVRVPGDEAEVTAYPWETSVDPYTIVPPVGAPAGLAERLTWGTFEGQVRRMSRGKAPGPDDVPNEVFQTLPERTLRSFHAFMVECWRMRRIPPSWKRSLTVLLYKKDDPHTVSNYRPIGLLSTVYKLYTSTVAEMLSDFAEEHGLLQVGQEGFRRLRGTGRQLQALVGAIEDSNLTQRDLLILYVDFVNAFGSVDHKRLFAAMRTMGVPDDCIEVIADLYVGATTQVCTPKGRTENVPFLGRGTVQGDSLSPLVFLLCIEPLLRWLAVGERGYRLGTSEETLDGLAYADDLAILVGTVRDTSVQIRKVAEFCAWSGMEVNIKGTDKTALTAKFYGERRVRNAEEATQLLYPSISWTAAAGAQPNGKPPKPIPFLLPTQQYVYLGVQVTLNLT